MDQPQQEHAVITSQTSEMVSKVIEMLVSKCMITRDDLQHLLIAYPRAAWLRGKLSLLIMRIKEVVPNAELLKITSSSTRNWRVFSFSRSFWLIYRDEPQCREVVAEFLYNNLYSDVFSLTPKTALTVVRHVLKNNGVKEEVIRLVQERLRNALNLRSEGKQQQ